MAILLSEDRDAISCLELKPGETAQVQDQTWQHFVLSLSSGDHKLALGNGKAADDPEPDACMFCKDPDDEMKDLVGQLEELVEHKRDKVLFEPAEPSFELEITRSSGIAGLKVHIWLDAGNAKTGIYRWDAAGIRFYTIQEHLVSFVKQLKQEFAC